MRRFRVTDEPHHRRCRGGKNCTLRSQLSAARLCRARKWKVGTVIAGEDGFGLIRLEITAIGEHSILARSETGLELAWTLKSRCWGRA